MKILAIGLLYNIKWPFFKIIFSNSLDVFDEVGGIIFKFSIII